MPYIQESLINEGKRGGRKAPAPAFYQAAEPSGINVIHNLHTHRQLGFINTPSLLYMFF
jgi:hypothetical protein